MTLSVTPPSTEDHENFSLAFIDLVHLSSRVSEQMQTSDPYAQPTKDRYLKCIEHSLRNLKTSLSHSSLVSFYGNSDAHRTTIWEIKVFLKQKMDVFRKGQQIDAAAYRNLIHRVFPKAKIYIEKKIKEIRYTHDDLPYNHYVDVDHLLETELLKDQVSWIISDTPRLILVATGDKDALPALLTLHKHEIPFGIVDVDAQSIAHELKDHANVVLEFGKTISVIRAPTNIANLPRNTHESLDAEDQPEYTHPSQAEFEQGLQQGQNYSEIAHQYDLPVIELAKRGWIPFDFHEYTKWREAKKPIRDFLISYGIDDETLNYFLRQESPSPSSPPFEGPPETDPKASSKSITPQLDLPELTPALIQKELHTLTYREIAQKYHIFQTQMFDQGLLGPEIAEGYRKWMAKGRGYTSYSKQIGLSETVLKRYLVKNELYPSPIPSSIKPLEKESTERAKLEKSAKSKPPQTLPDAVPSPSEPTPERSAPAVSMESVQVAFSSGQTYREIAQESGLPMSELYNRGFIQIDKEDYHQWRDMGKSKTAYCKKVGLSEILFRRILKEQNMDYPLGLSSSDQLPSPLQSTDPEDSDPNIAQTLEDNLLHTLAIQNPDVDLQAIQKILTLPTPATPSSIPDSDPPVSARSEPSKTFFEDFVDHLGPKWIEHFRWIQELFGLSDPFEWVKMTLFDQLYQLHQKYPESL